MSAGHDRDSMPALLEQVRGLPGVSRTSLVSLVQIARRVSSLSETLLRLFPLCLIVIAGCKTRTSRQSPVNDSSKNLIGSSERPSGRWEYKTASKTTVRSRRMYSSKPLKAFERSWKEIHGRSPSSWRSRITQRRPHTYLYKDIYFDTPRMDLLRNHLSYRLRYRFKSSGAGIHDLFPSRKEHWPIRCEIQFKNSQRQAPSRRGKCSWRRASSSAMPPCPFHD